MRQIAFHYVVLLVLTLTELFGSTTVAFFMPLSPPPRKRIHSTPRNPKLALGTPTSKDSEDTSAILTTTTIPAAQDLSVDQRYFTLGYLNKHEGDSLLAFAEYFSELGKIKAKKNGWSGGSYVLEAATIVEINPFSMQLDVTVQERSKSPVVERVTIALDGLPVTSLRIKPAAAVLEPIPREDAAAIATTKVLPVDDMVRRLNRLCWIVNHKSVTGRLIQMAIQIGGAEIGKLNENMYLNQVPHNRYVRKYFYNMAAAATLEAVQLCSQGKISNRMKLISMFPEMNPSMDSYRIGTILEMVRTMAIKLCEENLRVRVCVQGSMGVGIFTGVPKQLSGVSKLLQMMDWQSEPGEENEGMVGNYLNFGFIGKDHVVNAHVDAEGKKIEQDDVFIIVAPQSMVGVDTSIIGPLEEMTLAAGDRPIILINPDLVDKVSSQGQQNVRGRQDRINFAESFKTIYHFQNIYVSGTSYFPILGSVTKLSPQQQWVAHQRRDVQNEQSEIYVPILSSEERPSGEEILEAFDR